MHSLFRHMNVLKEGRDRLLEDPCPFSLVMRCRPTSQKHVAPPGMVQICCHLARKTNTKNRKGDDGRKVIKLVPSHRLQCE